MGEEKNTFKKMEVFKSLDFKSFVANPNNLSLLKPFFYKTCHTRKKGIYKNDIMRNLRGVKNQTKTSFDLRTLPKQKSYIDLLVFGMARQGIVLGSTDFDADALSVVQPLRLSCSILV